MNWADVKRAFNTHFNSWAGIPNENKFGIENENSDLPDPDVTWVRMTLRFGEVFDGEFGGVNVQGGIAFFDVFTPIGVGDVPGLELCDSLRTHFRDEDLFYGSGKVSCDLVNVETLGRDDLFNHNQVKVNFINFIEI